MKYSGILSASTILFTLSAAAPLNKRDYVIKTAYAEVTEVVPCTKTIYVDTMGHTLPEPSAAAPTNAGQFYQAPPNAVPSKPAAPVEPSKPAAAPSKPAAPAYSAPASKPAAPAYSAPASSAPAPPAPPASSAPAAPVYTPPAPVSSAPAPPAPVSSAAAAYTPPAPAPVPSSSPAPAPAPAYTAPAASTPSAASYSSSKQSGVCPPGAPCTGDITYYDATVGTGACGETPSKSEMLVALPWQLMGTASNSNPYCNKLITVKFNGKTITDIPVKDKCMGCTGNSIDLSQPAFEKLASTDLGRGSGAEWFFQ